MTARRLIALLPVAAVLAGAPAAHAAAGGMLAQDAPATQPATTSGTAPTALTGGLSSDDGIRAGAVGGAASSDPGVAPVDGQIIAADVPFGPLIAVTARRYGVSVPLFTALVWHESGFNARARSKAGARGLTQLMPSTARSLGVTRIYDPSQNLDAGARYLQSQLLRFGGDERLALAAYNAGPGAVVKHKGIPPYRETRSYVTNVLAIEAVLVRSGVR